MNLYTDFESAYMFMQAAMRELQEINAPKTIVISNNTFDAPLTLADVKCK